MPVAEAPPPSAAAAVAESAALGASRASSGNTGKNLDAAFSNLEKFAKPPSSEPGTIPPHPSQKKAEPPPPKPPEKPALEEKSEETPPAPEQKTEQKVEQKAPEQKIKKPADFLREKLAKTEQERDTFKAELEKSKTAAPTEDPEKKGLQERLEAAEKRANQWEEEMRFANYERSTEYKEKFERPYIDSWQAGREWVSKLKLTDAEGNQRQASAADFDAIMEMAFRDPDSAAQHLDALFGNKASSIAPFMVDVQKAGRAASKAIENYRETGSEREKAFTEAHKNLGKQIAETWQKAVKPDMVPDKWKPYVLPKGNDDKGQPVDKDGDTLLEKGLKEFDTASGEDARNPNLSPEQRAAILGRAAAIRNKAASFGRLVRWLEQRDAKIGELEKELEAYRASEPGGGEGDTTETGKTAVPANTMEAALAGLEKRATPRYY